MSGAALHVSPKLAFLIALALLALAIWPALHGPFLFDDFQNLAPLARDKPLDGWSNLGAYLSENRMTAGRALSMLSFVPQQDAWPGDPFPFKLVNLLIHLLNAVLVFVLANALLGGGLAAKSGVQSRKTTQWVAALAAVGWAASPIQLSTTMLVIQRMTELMASFALLGCIACVNAIRSPRLSTPRRFLWSCAGVFACGGAAVLCKENGALLPIYVAVLYLTVLAVPVQQMKSRSRRWACAPVIGLAIAVVALLLWFAPRAAQGYAMRDFSLGDRLRTEPRILFDYLGGFFLPGIGKYGLMHDDFPVSHSLFEPWTTLPAILAVIGGAIAAIALRKRYPPFAFAVLWFLAGHIMESSFIPLELYFDHRNYLPLVGPCIALAAVVARAASNGNRIALLVALAWLAASAFSTTLNARIWSSERTLAAEWYHHHPDSPRAAMMVAEQMIRDGEAIKALGLMRTTRDRFPTESSIAIETLWLACQAKDVTQHDADTATGALRNGAFRYATVNTLAQIQAEVEAKMCPNALNHDSFRLLAGSILANHAFSANPVAVGITHYQLGILEFRQGNLDRALEEFGFVERVDPDPDLFLLEANLLSEAHRYDEALAALDRGEKINWPKVRSWASGVNKKFAAMRAEIVKRRDLATPANAAMPPIGDKNALRPAASLSCSSLGLATTNYRRAHAGNTAYVCHAST
jgi:hypothetical protein